MRELLPDDIDFIRMHHGLDMVPAEMARALSVSVDDVVMVARCAGIHGARRGQTLSSFCNPSFPRVAVNVRKATANDAFVPMDGAKFQRQFRPKSWRPCP